MITYKNVTKYALDYFEDFEFDSTLYNGTMLMTKFYTYIENAILNKNESLLIKQADFINKMAQSEDENVNLLVDDIALSLYTEGYYENIKPHLSAVAIEAFDLNIKLWKKGNNIKD